MDESMLWLSDRKLIAAYLALEGWEPCIRYGVYHLIHWERRLKTAYNPPMVDKFPGRWVKPPVGCSWEAMDDTRLRSLTKVVMAWQKKRL